MNLSYITLTGDSFAQGFAHGQALRNSIFHNLNLYFYRFQHECRLTKDEVLARARLYESVLAERFPSYFAGLQGIAAGAGADLLEIVALNVRYEILYYQYAIKGIADGCTSLVVDRSRSENGRLLLAQNWDWFPEAQGALVHTIMPNGHEILAFSEAGIFGGKIGLNSAGIGLLINGLVSLQDDWTTLAMPFHVRCFEILQQQRFTDALAVVTDEQRSCSANFVIGSRQGDVVDIEAAPERVHLVTAVNGTIVHTNHFLDPQLLGIQEPMDERINTEHRYGRMCNLLKNHGSISLTDVKAWLSDHDGYPNSICQHADPDVSSHEQYATVVSIILDLDALQMHVATGNPCAQQYQTYEVPSRITDSASLMQFAM